MDYGYNFNLPIIKKNFRYTVSEEYNKTPTIYFR